jgi:hypothetical protein
MLSLALLVAGLRTKNNDRKQNSCAEKNTHEGNDHDKIIKHEQNYEKHLFRLCESRIHFFSCILYLNIGAEGWSWTSKIGDITCIPAFFMSFYPFIFLFFIRIHQRSYICAKSLKLQFKKKYFGNFY